MRKIISDIVKQHQPYTESESNIEENEKKSLFISKLQDMQVRENKRSNFEDINKRGERARLERKEESRHTFCDQKCGWMKIFVVSYMHCLKGCEK